MVAADEGVPTPTELGIDPAAAEGGRPGRGDAAGMLRCAEPGCAAVYEWNGRGWKPSRCEAHRRKARPRKGAAPEGKRTIRADTPKAGGSRRDTPKDDTPGAGKLDPAERRARVAALEAQLVAGVPKMMPPLGMALRIPAAYLLTPVQDAHGEYVRNAQGLPEVALTHYGQALAPPEPHLHIYAEAWVRFTTETEAGAKLLTQYEEASPWLYVGAAGVCAATYVLAVAKAGGVIRANILARTQADPGTPPQDAQPAAEAAGLL